MDALEEDDDDDDDEEESTAGNHAELSLNKSRNTEFGESEDKDQNDEGIQRNQKGKRIQRSASTRFATRPIKCMIRGTKPLMHRTTETGQERDWMNTKHYDESIPYSH